MQVDYCLLQEKIRTFRLHLKSPCSDTGEWLMHFKQWKACYFILLFSLIFILVLPLKCQFSRFLTSNKL